ncbi:MAG TPA: OmpA family protein [Steroidobacteraceae bacterium]|nr:OmpA family protein [Steroidobacteraceae bacterium]
MMKRLALLCALTVPALASASDVGRWYLTPMAGAIRADRDRPVDDRTEALGGLALGKHFSEAWSAEVLLNGAKLDGAPGFSDLSVYGASLDVLRVFNREGAFAPYIGIGAGAIENDLKPGAAGEDAMAQASLGAFWRLWESANGSSSFSLRPDFKARWDDAHSAGRLVDYIGTLGFQFAWGAPTPVAAPPPPPPPPPPAMPAPAPEPPVPATPPDTDHDGVTDDRDQCPGTPAGVAVDSNGCPQKGSITLDGVTFDYDSARLTSNSLGTLDTVAEGLKKHPRLRVELQGHTDSKGPDQYNLNLSQKRAESVREYLVKDGVASTQMVAKGYGEAKPIADNKTEDGRAQNRRVVMYVLDNPGDVKVEGEGAVK